MSGTIQYGYVPDGACLCLADIGRSGKSKTYGNTMPEKTPMAKAAEKNTEFGIAVDTELVMTGTGRRRPNTACKISDERCYF